MTVHATPLVRHNRDNAKHTRPCCENNLAEKCTTVKQSRIWSQSDNTQYTIHKHTAQQNIIDNACTRGAMIAVQQQQQQQHKFCRGHGSERLHLSPPRQSLCGTGQWRLLSITTAYIMQCAQYLYTIHMHLDCMCMCIDTIHMHMILLYHPTVCIIHNCAYYTT